MTGAAKACRGLPTPVFLISFNRGAMLRQAVAAVRRMDRPTEIIIHDNGSTDPDTLAILADMDNCGITVFRHPQISSADDLNHVNDTVQTFFSQRGDVASYVVSDCDVDMSVASGIPSF